METNKEGSLEKGNLSEELVKILKSLALEWGDDVENIDNYLEIVRLTSLNNKVYRVNWPTKSQHILRSVVVRIYGEVRNYFIDPEEENKTFEWMSNNGYGPRLYARLSNGRVEEFIQGRTLSPSDLINPEISTLVAAKIREFHMLDKPGLKSVVLWDSLRKSLSATKRLCSNERIEEFAMEDLEDEINMLENELSKGSQEVVFCHNDLYGGNMLFNEATKDLILIDYEYACYNPAAYDLSHLFWITETYVGEGTEERHRFIRSYLSCKGYQPTLIEIENFNNEVEKYTLADYLRIGLWLILSNAHSNNSDINCLGSARKIFEMYWLKRPKFFSTKPSKINDLLNVQE